MNRLYEWYISSTGIQRIITRIVFIILTYNVPFANNRKKKQSKLRMQCIVSHLFVNLVTDIRFFDIFSSIF